MALIACHDFRWPDEWFNINTANYSNNEFTMNASGDRIAVVLQVPKTGTLEQFEFRVATVTNNPDNGIRLSFQDISLTTGNPDGTQDQFCDIPGPLVANTWTAPPNALTNDGTGGGVKRSVTQGDLLGCVIDFVTFVASDSFGVAYRSLGTPTLTSVIYTDDGSSGAYVKRQTEAIVIALKYDDGTYVELPSYFAPVNTVNNTAYASNSTPDERALRFQVPFTCKVRGAWIRINFAGAVDIVLYDNASSVLATASLDVDVKVSSGSIQDVYAFFSSEIELTINTTYRLSIKPTTTTTITLQSLTVSVAGLMAGITGGAQLYLSTRTDAGAWTDTTTERPIAGLVISALSDGVSSGGSGGSFPFVG